jgi:hypothetical protein
MKTFDATSSKDVFKIVHIMETSEARAGAAMQKFNSGETA